MTVAPPSPPTASLLAAYRQHEVRSLIRGLIAANLVGFFGMPGGIVLDYFVYPDQVGFFLAIRLAVDALLLGIIGYLYFRRDRLGLTQVKVLGVISALIFNVAFCLMIYRTDGALSHYYAALNLIITCFSILLPWTAVETAVMCVATLGFYTFVCVTNPTFADRTSHPLFAYNSFFIVITMGVCVAITVFLSRARFADFELRHRLDAQNRELQDLDRMKTEFFSNVSHELRTPLTLILGPVEALLARSEGLDARVHEGLILIQRNSLRLLKLINDLLDLTRLDQGADILRKETFAVGAHVRGIVDSVRHLGLPKQLRIRTEEGDNALTVTADPARLEKVLVNLLTNAIKYTPPGGAITARWRSAEGSVVIEVEDTGIGIPREDLGRVFDRFHQVRGNAANQIQGVGIGLALAKELVEQHGGRIEVESTFGKGSVFRVTLPPAPAESAAVEPAATGAEEPFERAFRSADRTLRSYVDEPDGALPARGAEGEVVLVADDENDMRQFLVTMLADDYRVVQARHGGNVADLVAEHEPAVALLDWMMPEKDGLAVCRELRANPANRDLKIMLLTARIDEKSKLEALRSGADDFLTKPFSSVEVKTRVANLSRAGRLQRELRDRNGELAEAVEKLQRTELMLIQSEKMNAIGSLSAGLLHEINNPLNYTLTAISLVRRQEDSLDEDTRELIADIEEGMIRIRDVITHLKNFAYPEKAIHRAAFPIGEAFRDAQKIVAKELLDCRVEVNLPDDLVVEGQRTQLAHVFMNLLGNAAHALARKPSGEGGMIAVSGWASDDAVFVEVADNGPGVPEELLTRVFEPFFTTRDVGSGMGLGLSICHTILEAHGGSIRVGNRPEGGAVFTIQLPLAIPSLKA